MGESVRGLVLLGGWGWAGGVGVTCSRLVGRPSLKLFLTVTAELRPELVGRLCCSLFRRVLLLGRLVAMLPVGSISGRNGFRSGFSSCPKSGLLALICVSFWRLLCLSAKSSLRLSVMLDSDSYSYSSSSRSFPLSAALVPGSMSLGPSEIREVVLESFSNSLMVSSVIDSKINSARDIHKFTEQFVCRGQAQNSSSRREQPKIIEIAASERLR